MTALVWGILSALVCIYFLFAALCASAKKEPPDPEPPKQPEPNPEPFIAWRVTGTGDIPETIALDMNELGEQYINAGQFHWEE